MGFFPPCDHNVDSGSVKCVNIAEPEPDVIVVDEDKAPADRVGSALECLPCYDPSHHWSHDSPPFLYWTIRDYMHAYRSGLTTPSTVSFWPLHWRELLITKLLKKSPSFLTSSLGCRTYHFCIGRIQQQDTSHAIIDLLQCRGSEKASCSIYPKIFRWYCQYIDIPYFTDEQLLLIYAFGSALLKSICLMNRKSFVHLRWHFSGHQR